MADARKQGSNPRGYFRSAVLFSLTVLLIGSAQGATAIRFSGALSGLVTDTSGKPRSGAAVSLFNQQEVLLQRGYTDLAGNFSFSELLPDSYIVQVTLATFVPTTRNKVVVKPGMRSLLEVSLSKVFSSIQVVSSVPAPGGLMSDDWKWTLRADPSMRPVLRALPQTASGKRAPAGTHTAAFHDSKGVVKISASDTALTSAAADEADLGTQFAFATSLYSNSQVRVAGNVGYASATGIPGAAIRTTFTHQVAGESPSVSVTMRQMNVATRVGQSMLGSAAGEASLPSLRTLSVSMSDRAQLSDAATLDYGSQLDTISFLDRMQYFSPWAKLTYELQRGRIEMAFTSGNAQSQLDSNDPADNLRNELTAVSMLPRLSQMNSRLEVQRGDDYEISYVGSAGPMEYRISGYHQYVSNATLMIADPGASLFSGDLMPSLFTSNAWFDAGNISNSGYSLSATRSLGDHNQITVAYGTLGVLTPGMGANRIADAVSLREAMNPDNRQSVTFRATGVAPRTGTRYIASYQYADLGLAVPMASFSTLPDRAEPGLNLAIRQPIPFLSGVGRIEATAEIRNILAQGYLPLSMTDGRQLLVVNTPRVFRGGLAFIF
ncbi:MAG TPA: carboxypeptidase-like regulatory domain-containing protein [Bryobacteraceae bacterium]|nr:carboxypeptidase-like regulatory domain-containing protein [Bryobacteraceae bacterium]